MNNKEQLHNALAATEWGQAAQEAQTWQWGIEEQAAHYAEILIGRVANNKCTVKELHAGVVWANALDAETVKLGISLDMNNTQGQEAVARRIAHHAGRKALQAVGSRAKLQNLRARRVSVSEYAL